MIPILTRAGEVSNMRLGSPRQHAVRPDTPKAPTVKEIIIEYLREHGFDGLCDFNCGCFLESGFMPCQGEGMDNCSPGYKCRSKDTDYDYMICETREVVK